MGIQLSVTLPYTSSAEEKGVEFVMRLLCVSQHGKTRRRGCPSQASKLRILSKTRHSSLVRDHLVVGQICCIAAACKTHARKKHDTRTQRKETGREVYRERCLVFNRS